MTTDRTNRSVILSSRPKGIPQAEHFTVQDEPVPELAEGCILIKTTYWSVDPAQRGWANDTPNYIPPVDIGATMRGFAVGEVVESKHADYTAGDVVSGLFGWSRYAISDGSNVDRKLTDPDLRPSLALGILGLNGLTAYFGLLDVAGAQEGDTVVVSTAAGAVGSAVGQIAKIKGCKTIGITSSAEKMALCTDSFGYDAVINYREDDVAEALRAAAPNGVNCYFDNTCGEISDAVMTQLAPGARIAVCGTAAISDWSPTPVGPRVNRQLLVARARMQGFVIFDFQKRFPEAIGQLSAWIKSGQLDVNEHILDGAEAARDAIAMLYRGENTGKLLIKVD